MHHIYIFLPLENRSRERKGKTAQGKGSIESTEER